MEIALELAAAPPLDAGVVAGVLDSLLLLLLLPHPAATSAAEARTAAPNIVVFLMSPI
jgi:hypothetical protein